MTSSPPSTRTVRVELAERAYDVRIGGHLLADLPGALAGALGASPRAVFVVYDANVEAHAGPAIKALRDSGCRVASSTVTATERDKSLDTLARVLAEMGSARLERTDAVIAVGGGITGDLAGFAAASYRRGLPIAQCPTTLLAMVDASVGGKTGVNLEVAGALQKNMVGAFHQPALVLADIDTLGTLPAREFRAGLAECVKHGLLDGCTGDAAHFAWIADNLDAVLARQPDPLIELIARSVAFKAAIVAGDERETADTGPGRALLNLGHTFAHAIETIPGLSPTADPAAAPLLHGEAVSLGLVAAAATSMHLGLAPAEILAKVRSMLGRCELPTGVAGLPEDDRLLSLMGADKKTLGGRLRLVLPTAGCRAELVTGPDHLAIKAGWAAIRVE